jgi:hypothetical protein
MIHIIPIAFENVAVQDAILEAISLFAYFFILAAAFYARKKNKIFATKGFPIMIISIILGLIASFMDLFTEFFWIESNYEAFKLSMSVIQILSLLLFTLALMLVFKFTSYLMGEEEN